MTHSNEGHGPLLFQTLSCKPKSCWHDSLALSRKKISRCVFRPTKERGLGKPAVAADHGQSVDAVSVAAKEENDPSTSDEHDNEDEHVDEEEHGDEHEGDDEDPQHAPIADTGSEWQDQESGLVQCLQGKLSVGEQACNPVEQQVCSPVEQQMCNPVGQQIPNPANWVDMYFANAVQNKPVAQMTATACSDQMSTAIPQALPDGMGYHDPSVNTSYFGTTTPCFCPTLVYQGQHGQTYDESAQYIDGTYSMVWGDQWPQSVPSVIDVNGVPIIPDDNNFTVGNQYNDNVGQPGPFNGTNMNPNLSNCSTPNLTPLEVSTLAYETLMRTENKMDKVLENLDIFKAMKEWKEFYYRAPSSNASACDNKNVPQGTSSMPASPSFHRRRIQRPPGRIPKLVRNPPLPKQGDPRSVKQIIAAYDRKLKVQKAKMTQRADRTIGNLKLDDKLDDTSPTAPEDSRSIFSPALNTATMLKNKSNKRIWNYFIRLNPKNNRKDMENVHARLIAQSNPSSKPWSGIMSDIKAVSSDAFSAWEDITGTREKIYDLFKDIPGVFIEVCRVEEEGNMKLMVLIPPFALDGKDYSWDTFNLAADKVEDVLALQDIYDVDVEIWETDFQLVVV
ncbi:hypothetical protein ACHAPO_010279 [Fusarium lateritium]